MQWIPLPTARLAAVVAAASVAVALYPGPGRMGLVVVNAALLLAFVADAVAAPSPSSVRIQREVPHALSLGASAPLSWRLVNTTARPCRVTIADEIAPSLRGAEGARGATMRLPARGRATASIRLTPTRRGRFRVAELGVRVDGPLRLAARQHRRVLTDFIRVYPPFGSRDEAELRINRGRILEVGLRSAQGRGGGTEFDSLREYTVDDEFRRIDWAATARSGRPTVRTYRAERNQSMLVLLDTGRLMAGHVAGAPRLEHAMDAAMLLVAVATRLGDRAGLVAFGQQVRAVVPPSANRSQLHRATEAIYALEPEFAESDYLGAFTETLSRFRRRALVVVLTELAEQAIADTLLPALPLIVRDHIVMIGSVQDPTVDEASRQMPVSSREAYVKAAAVAAIEERHRLVRRLRAAGATVVDAVPGKLAPDLGDAYLDIKAAGRL